MIYICATIRRVRGMWSGGGGGRGVLSGDLEEETKGERGGGGGRIPLSRLLSSPQPH